jgi:transcriptional antiterminator RfaH
MDSEHINSDKNITQNWFAVYTKPRAEKKVFERITHAGFEAFLPLLTTMRVWSDRKKKVEIPLINSYVFVRTDVSSLYNVLKCEGTVNILKFLGKPAIIKDYEIQNLSILIKDPELLETGDHPHFEKGEAVKVIRGPFTGLIAESVMIHGKHRIVVELEALGNLISINVPLSFVEKIR